MSTPSPALDLGRLDGPVLVFGGPYGNLEATRAVLAEAAARGISGRNVICTGDVCAYGADPRATVDLLRRAAVTVVMGNCEEALGTAAEDCGCGFAAETACDALSRQWYAHAARHLDADARAWMLGLPRHLLFRLGGRRWRVVHGGVTRINRFIFRSTATAAKRRELDAAGADGVIAGHCGLPFTQRIGDRLWHNAGAVGMPANDGTPRGWFSVLTPTPAAIRVEHLPLAYDHAAAAGKMRARGLPKGYADGLETGLWPSLDVLPTAERRRTGRPLRPRRLTWAAPGGLSPSCG